VEMDMTRSRRAGGGQLLIGLVILTIGVFFLLDNLGMRVPRVTRLWPLILVAVGAAKVLQQGLRRSFWGITLIAVGLLLFLDEFHVLPVNPWGLWPLLLVAVGLKIVWQGAAGSIAPAPASALGVSSQPVLNETAVFGGGERRIASKDFSGGYVTAVFGGLDIDLKECEIRDREPVIHVVCAFGGAGIKVPPQWNVTLNVFSIFGGCDDKTVHPTDPAAPRLVITGVTMFGGADVTN
jgi:predicted membrane protein